MSRRSGDLIQLIYGADMDWMADGACAGMSGELFFAERGDSTVEAKAVCAGCPVRQECLDFAISTRQLHGIWGGLSERERRRLRRRPRRVA